MTNIVFATDQPDVPESLQITNYRNKPEMWMVESLSVKTIQTAEE